MNRSCRKALSFLGAVLLPWHQLFSLFPPSVSSIPTPAGLHTISHHGSGNLVALTLPGVCVRQWGCGGWVGRRRRSHRIVFPLFMWEIKRNTTMATQVPREKGYISSLSGFIWLLRFQWGQIFYLNRQPPVSQVRTSHLQGVLTQAGMECYYFLFDFQATHVRSTLSTPRGRLVQVFSFTPLTLLNLDASTMQLQKPYWALVDIAQDQLFEFPRKP